MADYQTELKAFLDRQEQAQRDMVHEDNLTLLAEYFGVDTGHVLTVLRPLEFIKEGFSKNRSTVLYRLSSKKKGHDLSIPARAFKGGAAGAPPTLKLSVLPQSGVSTPEGVPIDLTDTELVLWAVRKISN
jgi:hypothetical protein